MTDENEERGRAKAEYLFTKVEHLKSWFDNSASRASIVEEWVGGNQDLDFLIQKGFFVKAAAGGDGTSVEDKLGLSCRALAQSSRWSSVESFLTGRPEWREEFSKQGWNDAHDLIVEMLLYATKDMNGNRSYEKIQGLIALLKSKKDAIRVIENLPDFNRIDLPGLPFHELFDGERDNFEVALTWVGCRQLGLKKARESTPEDMSPFLDIIFEWPGGFSDDYWNECHRLVVDMMLESATKDHNPETRDTKVGRLASLLTTKKAAYDKCADRSDMTELMFERTSDIYNSLAEQGFFEIDFGNPETCGTLATHSQNKAEYGTLQQMKAFLTFTPREICYSVRPAPYFEMAPSVLAEEMFRATTSDLDVARGKAKRDHLYAVFSQLDFPAWVARALPDDLKYILESSPGWRDDFPRNAWNSNANTVVRVLDCALRDPGPNAPAKRQFLLNVLWPSQAALIASPQARQIIAEIKDSYPAAYRFLLSKRFFD